VLSLLGGPLAVAIDASLGSVAGPVAVIDQLGLMRRLVRRGRDALLVTSERGLLRRAGERGRSGRRDALPFSSGELAGLVASGLGDADGKVLLAAWCLAVRPDGIIVSLDRGDPSVPACRALCGGLTEIAQRPIGRTLVTRGRVVDLDDRGVSRPGAG
jgi:hypothetical protein